MDKPALISGIRWTLFTSFFRRTITLLLFYFLAKWLTKDDLGVFREYSLILAFLSGVTLLSLDMHYIIEQKRRLTGLLALWQSVLLASAVWLIILTLASGLLGKLYQSPLLGSLFLWTSLFLVLEIWRKAVRAVAQKNRQFRQLALAETANVVFYSLLTVCLLFFWRYLWLYLVLFYLGNLVETIWLWRLNSSAFHRIFRNLLRKARWQVLRLTLLRNRAFLSVATLVTGINQFSGNAPVFVLGLLVSPLYMGLFYFASQLIGVPVGMFTTAVNQVFFPVFAGQKDGDIHKTASRYVRLIGAVGLPLLMLFGFILMHATVWLFGSKWQQAIPLIPVMFLLFGSSLYCNPLSGIPFLKRKPAWELWWNIIGLVVRVSALLLGMRVSFREALWLYAYASALMNLAFYLMSMKLLQVKLRESLTQVCVGLIPTFLFALVINLVRHHPAWQSLTLATLFCALIILLTDLVSGGKLRSDIRLLLNK